MLNPVLQEVQPVLGPNGDKLKSICKKKHHTFKRESLTGVEVGCNIDGRYDTTLLESWVLTSGLIQSSALLISVNGTELETYSSQDRLRIKSHVLDQIFHPASLLPASAANFLI